MNATPHLTWRPHLLAVGLALVLTGMPLSGCTEVEEASSGGYEPAKLEPVDGAEVKRVRFTAEGAKRTGLQTAPVQEQGKHQIVPYAALIYDAEGKSYVYANPEPLTFLRTAVQVERIEGNRVLLAHGPPAGSEIVTVGASEVYGTELEIAGGH